MVVVALLKTGVGVTVTVLVSTEIAVVRAVAKAESVLLIMSVEPMVIVFVVVVITVTTRVVCSVSVKSDVLGRVCSIVVVVGIIVVTMTVCKRLAHGISFLSFALIAETLRRYIPLELLPSSLKTLSG